MSQIDLKHAVLMKSVIGCHASRMFRRRISSTPAIRSSSNAYYPSLFTPLSLNEGKVVLPNRVLMGSMHTGLEEPGGLLHYFVSGELNEMAAFYRERAKGGVGLIVTGGVAPNAAGRALFGMICIHAYMLFVILMHSFIIRWIKNVDESRSGSS